jgi:hypothetical protein
VDQVKRHTEMNLHLERCHGIGTVMNAARDFEIGDVIMRPGSEETKKGFVWPLFALSLSFISAVVFGLCRLVLFCRVSPNPVFMG